MQHPVRRFEAGRFVSIADAVALEERIELHTGEAYPAIGMLCLPTQLDALAVGFLLGEGILRKEDLSSLRITVCDRNILVSGDFDADALESVHRRWTWGTGCGSGGTSRDLDDSAYSVLPVRNTISAQRLLDLSRHFHRRLTLWLETGGVHACALADNQSIHIIAEDVGRHNAFDKIMGLAALRGLDAEDKVVLTTGRLSAEIVSKAAACRVPILASRSAATSLAIAVARRFGLTLVGFARGRRLNVYTGFERITTSAKQPKGTSSPMRVIADSSPPIGKAT